MDWRHRAICRDEDPELFFPIGNTGPALLQIEQAKAVCRRCPVDPGVPRLGARERPGRRRLGWTVRGRTPCTEAAQRAGPGPAGLIGRSSRAARRPLAHRQRPRSTDRLRAAAGELHRDHGARCRSAIGRGTATRSPPPSSAVTRRPHDLQAEPVARLGGEPGGQPDAVVVDARPTACLGARSADTSTWPRVVRRNACSTAFCTSSVSTRTSAVADLGGNLAERARRAAARPGRSSP